MKPAWTNSRSSTRTRAWRSAAAWPTASANRNGYQGFDYADPENREFAKKAVEMAARHFDEILLDDYYFFDRKTDYDIKAKGNRSWTQYRLDTMREVTKNLIVGAGQGGQSRSARSSSRWPTGMTNTPAWATTLKRSRSLPTACSPARNPASGSDRNSISSRTSATTSCGSWTTSSPA